MPPGRDPTPTYLASALLIGWPAFTTRLLASEPSFVLGPFQAQYKTQSSAHIVTCACLLVQHFLTGRLQWLASSRQLAEAVAWLSDGVLHFEASRYISHLSMYRCMSLNTITHTSPSAHQWVLCLIDMGPLAEDALQSDESKGSR